jgi:hypothetical protein
MFVAHKILTTPSTQFQENRRVILHLAASVNSPGEGEHDGEYFAPRVFPQKAPVRDVDWGADQTLYLRFAIEDTGIHTLSHPYVTMC